MQLPSGDIFLGPWTRLALLFFFAGCGSGPSTPIPPDPLPAIDVEAAHLDALTFNNREIAEAEFVKGREMTVSAKLTLNPSYDPDRFLYVDLSLFQKSAGELGYSTASRVSFMRQSCTIQGQEVTFSGTWTPECDPGRYAFCVGFLMFEEAQTLMPKYIFTEVVEVTGAEE